MGFPIWLVENAAPAGGDRRAAARALPFVTGRDMRVEALGFDVMALHRPAWHDLADRAIEANVFLDADFALAAAQHFAPAARPVFLVARAHVEGRMRLVGLCPLGPSLSILGPPRVWTHDYANLGTPLLDRACAAEAFEALLAFVARERPRAGALVFPALREDGPVAALIRERARRGARARAFDPRRRAALTFDAPPAPPNKTQRRQWRRLAEEGALAFRLIERPNGVRDAAERFLALETAGWKGEVGTAMLQEAGDAAFARVALRQMARRGRCRIAELTLDGAPVALAVLLVQGRTAMYWKIAHDPRYDRFSPGVQLTLRLTEALRTEGALDLVDSCAVEGHTMIEPLWPARIALIDAAVSLPRRETAFGRALARESLRRNARGLAKRMFYLFSRRKTN